MSWSDIKIADRLFSIFIRKRDGRCMNPKCRNGFFRGVHIKFLECSHFWNRQELISRFDPDNCMALCHDCHVEWEHTKQGKYRDLMISVLGIKRYKQLEKRVEDYKYKNFPQMRVSDAVAMCYKVIKNKNG